MNTRVKAFFESEIGKLLHQQLVEMTRSEKYNTRTTYSVHDANGMNFVDKHMKYMSQFPNLDTLQYVSNLKLMTRRS